MQVCVCVCCVCLATNYKFQLCTDCALLHKTQKHIGKRTGIGIQKIEEGRVESLGLMEPIKRAKAIQSIEAYHGTMNHTIE